jgi:hypothetical protein
MINFIKSIVELLLAVLVISVILYFIGKIFIIIFIFVILIFIIDSILGNKISKR